MTFDVAAVREKNRQRRLARLLVVLAPLATWVWVRHVVRGDPISPGLPNLGPDAILWVPGLGIVLVLALVLILPMKGNGKSPHTIYLPEQIDVSFADVKGLGSVSREVQHTLEVFLNHKRFREEMGGNPRRGVLFEGPPGTGKTHVAKALAAEAGVPFLYVSSTAFQSMWYGATARKIRSYFRDLRKIAREHGGAIGFIEEIDAIALKRGAMEGSTARIEAAGSTIERSAMSSGTGGVVNELLIQMQSFDEPTRRVRFKNWFIRLANGYLPAHRQIKAATPGFANVLLIGATNRADALDPALLRPGRFDRILHFGLPNQMDRMELVEYFMSSRSYVDGLDAPNRIKATAARTMGYSPAALEGLFDEALLVALRDGRREFTENDLHQAQMEVEIGLPNPTLYTPEDRETVATHEAGHATIAYLVGKNRRLEVLSIVKRKDSLGLLSHRDVDERHGNTRSEMVASLQIALGGMVAEEEFLQESGTGPSGDLKAATTTACMMVGVYGLGESLASFLAVPDSPLAPSLVARVLDNPGAKAEVESILAGAKTQTSDLVRDHRYLVEALRDALLEREELIGDEILEVLRLAETKALKSGRVVVHLSEDGADLVEPGKDIDLFKAQAPREQPT